MSTGLHGHGATLSIDGTAVGNIISISGPEISRDALDISTMDSATKHREFKPGMIDSGEVTAELNYDGTTVAAFLLARTKTTATAGNLIITISDDDGTTNKSTYTGTCFVTSLGHAIPFDDKVTQSLGLKLTSTLALT